MELGLSGRVVIVTGGSAGIGAAIVRALADEGAVPVVFDRAPPEGAPDRVDFCPVDLTDIAACEAAVRNIAGKHDKICGLVNNAGVNDGAGLDAGVAAFRASLSAIWCIITR